MFVIFSLLPGDPLGFLHCPVQAIKRIWERIDAVCKNVFVMLEEFSLAVSDKTILPMMWIRWHYYKYHKFSKEFIQQLFVFFFLF